jgi:AcrR family transcriptional regulator
MSTVDQPPRTARQRARVELTQAIKDIARRQLAAEGAPALSLRAVARELGMVSSAVYRYFPSRDELLTALIVDAYDAVGAAAEKADAALPRDDLIGRWRAACGAIRTWAVDNPHEYALLYGSPVPGYRAPAATIEHASRVTNVLLAIMRAAIPGGTPEGPALTPALARDATRVAKLVMPGASPRTAVRAIIAWTQIFGAISFELFGHLVGSIEDYAAFFDEAVMEMARFTGLAPPDSARSAPPSTSRGTRPARRSTRA